MDYAVSLSSIPADPLPPTIYPTQKRHSSPQSLYLLDVLAARPLWILRFSHLDPCTPIRSLLWTMMRSSETPLTPLTPSPPRNRHRADIDPCGLWEESNWWGYRTVSHTTALGYGMP